MAREDHFVHYERVPINASRKGFHLPDDVVAKLGGGNTETGHVVLHEVLGGHVLDGPVVDPNVVREIGNGDLTTGRRVLQKFIAKVRKGHATEGHAEGGEKLTKASANYRQGEPNRKCGICSMFERPDGCSAVAGHIAPQGLCDLFERG